MSIRGLQRGTRVQVSEKFQRSKRSEQKSEQDDLLVVVDEEPLHDENMDPLVLHVGFLSVR